MRNLFVKSDGRLRTGRVSSLLFLGLLLSLSLLFYLQKPMDKAVVVVRHIFTAPASPRKKPAIQKPVVRPDEKKVSPAPAASKPAVPEPPLRKAALEKPVAGKETAARSEEQSTAPPPASDPAPRPRPEKTRLAEMEKAVLKPIARKEAGKIAAAAGDVPPVPAEARQTPPVPQKPEMAASDSARPAASPEAETVPVRPQVSPPTVSRQAATAHPAAKPAAPSRIDLHSAELTAAYGNAAAAAKTEENPQSTRPRVVFKPLPAGILTPAASGDTKPVTTELLAEEEVEDLQQRWQEKPRPAASAPALMSDSSRRLLAGLVRENQKPVSPAATPAPERRNSKPVSQAPAPAPVSASRANPPVRTSTTAAAGGSPPAITVDKKHYSKLHRAWRQAGRDDKHPDRLIPLRIENLRQAYNYLQMKPVVIRGDGSCIDLSDGRHLPPAFLDRFSTIVIRVSEPWEKWGAELKRAGVRPGEKFEIRYYLYDFVRRALYARVNQAYDWARQRGLLTAATRPDEVDVLGRAYVVNRSGGGAFGVFVPRLLTTRNGRTVKIDPRAFPSAPEVAALQQAGVI